MPTSSVRVAIVGASGYTGEELLRVCLQHPGIKLTKLTSRQYKGTRLDKHVPCSSEAASMEFQDLSPAQVADGIDAAFLCLPHGVAAEYAQPLLDAGKIVFDLSADFRLKKVEDYREFYHQEHPAPHLLKEAVYGLPEFHRDELKSARLIACPGCYPTSIQLGLVPGLQAKLISPEDIIINSQSGFSGAGKKADVTYLFCECHDNLRAYGLPSHRHIPEIEQELSLAAGHPLKVSFTPHLVPINRGMFTTISAKPLISDLPAIIQHYQKTYASSPFVRVLDGDLPQTNRVIRSNRAEIALVLDKRVNRLTILSTIDNLGKGAATQAIQSFNVRYGFTETTGLNG